MSRRDVDFDSPLSACPSDLLKPVFFSRQPLKQVYSSSMAIFRILPLWYNNPTALLKGVILCLEQLAKGAKAVSIMRC